MIFAALLAVNLGGASAAALDKRRAVIGGRRIRERTLFLWCLAGGCPGVYLTMRAIRHKTRHKRFMLGIPAIFIAQILICAAVYWTMIGGNHLL